MEYVLHIVVLFEFLDEFLDLCCGFLIQLLGVGGDSVKAGFQNFDAVVLELLRGGRVGAGGLVAAQGGVLILILKRRRRLITRTTSQHHYSYSYQARRCTSSCG